MKRSQDTFTFTKEFGLRLRDLRLKAGLTQLELARVMGRAGRKAGNLVGRLERGEERYPSFGLVADLLRACRARFGDIADILDLYTDLPTAQSKVYDSVLAKVTSHVIPKWRTQVTAYYLRFDFPSKTDKPVRERPKPDQMKRLEVAKKMTAAARRRSFYGGFLMGAVNRTGLTPTTTVRIALFNHGLEWFKILRRTRKSRPEVREKLLAQCEDRFAKGSELPLPAIRRLQEDVLGHFRQMEMKGDMDWVPNLSLEQYEASLLAPARKRVLKQEQQDEFLRKYSEYDKARKAAVERVWDEAQPMLDEAGVPKERRPVYRGLVGVCCTAALSFAPGSSGERAQLDEYILEPRWIQLGLDTALAQKLAKTVLARFRELARSFPPDPRPKR
jgi:transcriptional regulator with XRE-family HTH domain